MTQKLFSSTELAGAILLHLATATQIEQFRNEPSDFLLEECAIDTCEVDVLLVENNANEVHLVLPYYSQILDFSSEAIGDSHLGSVSGGEIAGAASVLIIGATIAGVIGTGLSYGATAAALVGGGFYAGQAVITRRSVLEADHKARGTDYGEIKGK